MAVKKIFRKVGDAAKLEIKLAPQEEIVLGCIPATKAGIERADLLAALEAKTAELKTKQKVASILGYYTKHLVDSKLVEVDRVETPAEKPAKAAKAA